MDFSPLARPDLSWLARELIARFRGLAGLLGASELARSLAAATGLLAAVAAGCSASGSAMRVAARSSAWSRPGWVPMSASRFTVACWSARAGPSGCGRTRGEPVQ